MNYDKLCTNVLKSNPKIRFAGIVNSNGTLIVDMNQIGVEQFLNPEETDMSISYSLQEWEKSKNLAYKIGNFKSSALEFDKITL